MYIMHVRLGGRCVLSDKIGSMNQVRVYNNWKDNEKYNIHYDRKYIIMYLGYG